MIETMNDSDSQQIQMLVNLVLAPGMRMYEQWKRRIISQMPKEERNLNMNKARQIVLLDV